MADQFTDRLSEYLDEELTPGERSAVEAHLGDCPDCRRLLDELREVAGGARALVPRPPQTDLWPGVATRLESQPRERSAPVVSIGAFRNRRDRGQLRRFSFTATQLAAAAAVLIVTSAGLSWLVRMRTIDTIDPPRVASAPSPAAGDQPTAVPVANFGDAQYEAAVSELRRALEEGRGRLEPRTIEVLERNLAIIDQAIDQARKALAADPMNAYLNSHLAAARRRKLDLLRDATSALANLAAGPGLEPGRS